MRQLADRPDWLHVRYEDCVTDPTGIVDVVADRLRLTDVEQMHATVNRPSVSSAMSTEQTRRLIETGHASDAVARWRQDLDDGIETWCDQLLEAFGIDPEVILAPA